MKTKFKKASFFSVPRKELFEFHERKDAFNLLTPEWDDIEVLSTASTLKPSDDVVRFNAKFLFLKFPFEMIHTEYEPHQLFVDEQKKGLFSSWKHRHQMVQGGWEKAPASMLLDEIQYSHPLLRFFNPFVAHRLKKLFEFRHETTGEHLAETTGQAPAGRRIIVTGATGLIGKRIVQILLEEGISVIAFVRNVDKARQALGNRVTYAQWDFEHPEKGDWKPYLKEADGVIHLAGTPLFQQRWTSAFKERMERSRVQGTRQLVDAIAQSDEKPGCFISASAVGIYGTDYHREVNEQEAHADDLLARICFRWEDETKRLEEAGVRAAQIRIGIVLSPESGVLKELMLPYMTGAGGVMGEPDPYINWIHLEDVARIFTMALSNEEMAGPYNAVAPNPVRNADFAKAFARVLNRPCLMRYPVSLLKLMIGEAGGYASGGPKVSAEKIQAAGYKFFFSELDPALRTSLGR